MFIHRKLCDAKCWIPVKWFSLADKSIKKSGTIAGLVKVEHSIDLQQSDVDYHAGWESEWLRWWSIFVNMMMLSLEIIFTVCRLNMQVVWRRSVCIALNLEGLLLLLIIYLSFGIESNTSFFSITPESLLLRTKSHLRRRIEKSVSVKQSRFIVKQPETTCTNGDNLEKGNIDGDEHINVKCGNLFGSSLLGYE